MVFEYAQKCLQHCKSLSLRISLNRQETELNETLYILLACRHKYDSRNTFSMD